MTLIEVPWSNELRAIFGHNNKIIWKIIIKGKYGRIL
jgi:hypothetical protein